MKQILLFLFGFCSGGIIAAGLFSFLVSIGAVTRIAGKLRMERKIRLLELVLTAGAAAGNVVNLYQPEWFHFLPYGFSILLLGLFGLEAGIFTGVLVMSLAEMLNTLPVFAHRLHLLRGMKYVIIALALGKAAGAWIYFYLIGG